MYRTISPNIRCGLKIKKKFSCRQPTFHKSAGGGGGVGVVWVWVSVLILLFSPDVWICRLLFVSLQPINIYLRSEIRENGKTAFFVSFADFSTILVQENFREGKQ